MVNIDTLQSIKDEYTEKALDALRTLKDGTGSGGENTGWLWLFEQHDIRQLNDIMETAEKIRGENAALVNIGIGGSYLAARSALTLLRSNAEVYFAGTGFFDNSFEKICKKLENNDFYINVVSKSGSTAETMLAFEQFRAFAEEKYGADEMRKHIICTSGRNTKLCKLSQNEGYKTFFIPENVGGRYSALTAAGLLPMAVAGIDIFKMIDGARKQMGYSLHEDNDNPSLIYASLRQSLYDSGKKIEMLSYPGEKMRYFSEWWRQLFSESEGKNGKGIFPSVCQLSADLHSLGQYMQDGERIIFETMLSFKDELRANTMLRSVTDGVCAAHSEGGVPVIRLTADGIDAENLGAMFYFFEVACGISAYMMGVNPFDQPGVEEYKAHIRSQLEKTQYERV